VTYPNQPPRPGPPAGGFRPGPPPGGFRPGPPPAGPQQTGPQQTGPQQTGQQQTGHRPTGHQPSDHQPGGQQEYRLDAAGGTGHPAVDAVLQALANAATLAPGDQIAEYEAAHQVLQETLAGIDR
jgi:hypothetical protein